MTDKQEKILYAALELFANEGYNAVSTNKISSRAGVSEGLIFRHFENKKGLLHALMKLAERKLQEEYAHIIFETEPKIVISKTIDLPFSLEERKHDFFRLIYKLKWENEFNNPGKLQPLIDKLEWAFRELGYKDPYMEAKLLENILDAITLGILREEVEAKHSYQSFLHEKYSV